MSIPPVATEMVPPAVIGPPVNPVPVATLVTVPAPETEPGTQLVPFHFNSSLMFGEPTLTFDRSSSSTSSLLPSIAAEALMSALTIVPSAILAVVTEESAILAVVTFASAILAVVTWASPMWTVSIEPSV